MSSKSSFTRPRHLRVHWDDEPDNELHGAEIRMKRLSVQDLRDMAKMDLDSDDESAIGAILDRLAEGLVSWNLVDEKEPGTEDVPRPCTREELEGDAGLALAILDKWMAVAGSVSGPLARRSASGSPSLEESALTDLRSESL